MTPKRAEIAAANALRHSLDAFHAVTGETLKSVWRVDADGCLTTIHFAFDSRTLTIAANADDDTIELSVRDTSDKSSSTNISNEQPWRTAVGTRFGWGWLTLNQQGYCDGVMLSFGGIRPQFVLNVVASSIEVATTTPLGPVRQ